MGLNQRITLCIVFKYTFVLAPARKEKDKDLWGFETRRLSRKRSFGRLWQLYPSIWVTTLKEGSRLDRPFLCHTQKSKTNHGK